MIHKRFQYIRKSLELEACRKKLDHVLRNGKQDYEQCFGLIESEHFREMQDLDEFLKDIHEANEPTVLPEKTSETLAQIAGWSFDDPSGPSEPLLTQEELEFLSIRKGSLDPTEWREMQSHVIHSFRFLSQIPWTKELKRIPEIAKAHHEKLDGSGYPYRMPLNGEEIPFESKMMTIADMFDALTATDRPYKKAQPIEGALDIIGKDVKSELLDPVLFNLFVDAKIYQLTAKD